MQSFIFFIPERWKQLQNSIFLFCFFLFIWWQNKVSRHWKRMNHFTKLCGWLFRDKTGNCIRNMVIQEVAQCNFPNTDAVFRCLFSIHHVFLQTPASSVLHLQGEFVITHDAKHKIREYVIIGSNLSLVFFLKNLESLLIYAILMTHLAGGSEWLMTICFSEGPRSKRDSVPI